MSQAALTATMRSMRTGLDAFVAARIDQPDQRIGGGWTLHDIVAHLALRDRMAVRRIDGTPLSEGEEVAGREPWDPDAFNEEMRARFVDRPMVDLTTESAAAFDAALAAAGAAPDADCATGARVWEVVDDDSVGHYAIHVPIRDLMAEQRAT